MGLHKTPAVAWLVMALLAAGCGSGLPGSSLSDRERDEAGDIAGDVAYDVVTEHEKIGKMEERIAELESQVKDLQEQDRRTLAAASDDLRSLSETVSNNARAYNDHLRSHGWDGATRASDH